MKKLFTLLAFVFTITTFAQAPQGFNYQATVRNSSGALIVNQNVNFKFNVMLNSQTSVPIFSETHYVPTDDLGQVNLVIGTGTASTGTFSTINWGTGNYYLGIELNTGSGYVAMGTTQLLSVPYALYANSAGSSPSNGKTSIFISGDVSNAEAAAQIASEIGIYTENVFIQNTTNLTSVDLSGLTSIVQMKITDNANLTSVNLNGLKKNYGAIHIASNAVLSSLSFPTYTVALDTLTVEKNAALTAINMPLLTKGGIRANLNTNLSSISMPVFTSGNVTILNNPIISALYLPVFNSGNLNVRNNSSIASINLPLFYKGKIRITDNSSLSFIGIPNFTVSEPYENTWGNYNPISFYNNALPSSVVNTLLHQMLSVTPVDGKTIELWGQNPPAPPTGQGIIDKQTLIDALNDVWTDNSVPTLTTTLTLTTRSSVVCGGNITYDGGASVYARGVCWSTSPNPTVALSTITVDGSGTDVFSSFISSLTPATTYYLRAYATNYVGTSYGNEISFTTKLGFEGTHKAIDAEYYRIGVFYLDEASWPAETVIEAVDATTYKVVNYLGPFTGNTWYFTVVNDVIDIPLTYNGTAQLGNAQPFISCASNPTDMALVNCASSNVVIRDNVNGKDRLKMSFGYYNSTGAIGPRVFYQDLELIVN